MHSLEVVLDDRTDHAIRDQWSALMDAGLPSQGRHQGASNRPHITMALADTLDAVDLSRLMSAAAALPLPVTIGGLMLFGGHRFVLSRLAVPSIDVLELQRNLTGALAAPADPHGSFTAGRWTPHITLAKRLTADQVAVALMVLGDVPTLLGDIPAARRWDMVGKQEQWINPSESS